MSLYKNVGLVLQVGSSRLWSDLAPLLRNYSLLHRWVFSLFSSVINVSVVQAFSTWHVSIGRKTKYRSPGVVFLDRCMFSKNVPCWNQNFWYLHRVSCSKTSLYWFYNALALAGAGWVHILASLEVTRSAVEDLIAWRLRFRFFRMSIYFKLPVR